MQKTIVIFQFILFALSIFLISRHFANPPAPTFYIAVVGCCLLAIAGIVLRYKEQTFSLSVSEILVGSFLLFAIANGVFSKSFNQEWIISVFSLFLFYLAIKRTKLTMEWLFAGLVFIGIVQAVYGLGQYVHWFRNIAASGFHMSGSFDNPAGFAVALSTCFPFALLLVSKKQLYWRIVGSFVAVIFSVAVALSQSRAGVLSIIIISGIWIIKYLNLKWLSDCNKRAKIVGSGILVIAILTGLYFIKKDSADGRLLIWQCSAQMIADKPLLGHGIGGFQREYMLYQAEYLKSHPDSKYAMLADIVKHPFNEFILLLVEHGLVGGLLVGLSIYYIIREYRRNKSSETFYAMLCLIGICIFACFSYPLGYPFIRLMAVFCLALIMKNEKNVWNIPQRFFPVLKPVMLVFSVGLLILTGKMFYDDYRWNTIAQRSLAGETKAVMPDYAQLYKTMNRNGLFLYNYGAELNYIDENVKSNQVFNEASHFMNDNDLQLQLADNYTKLKMYKKAESCLLLASNMIPNRFIPLYRLAKLYEETQQINKAKAVAIKILNKPIKVISPEIVMIKTEMRELLNKQV